VFIGSCGITPYPDELLYSYQARLRTRFAIKSPKALIEKLYDNRSVAASWMYSSHLKNMAASMPINSQVSARKLAYHHTLLPLSAPFLTGKRRSKIERLMSSKDAGGVHVLSGYVACKLPKLTYPRYCPMCSKEQIIAYGEPFWTRLHQVTGINYCHIHNIELCSYKEITKGQNRHEFISAASCDLSGELVEHWCKYNKIISEACIALLNNDNLPSPSFAQWTNHYRQLARSYGYLKGAYIDFEPIKNTVLTYWPEALLVRNNLLIDDKQTGWLHTIFRKHRKSFSYLEHIIVNAAFLGSEFDIVVCIKSAASSSNKFREVDSVVSNRCTSTRDLSEQQSEWHRLLQDNAPKLARSLAPAIYTAIYRSDRNWLLSVNKGHKAKRTLPSDRVDWHRRDVSTVKSLFQVIYKTAHNLSIPRQTKRWLMYQLSNTAKIEKYLRKLPMTDQFFSRYSETISEYQIRRITRVLLTDKHPYITRRWFLLRASGLSEERMTRTTRLFIEELAYTLPIFEINASGLPLETATNTHNR